MTPRAPQRILALFTMGALALATACASDEDDVCENVAACEAGGNTEQVQACQDEADLSKKAASQNGCASAFEAYYGCADDHFTCTGNKVTFPGCDDARKALDACFERTSAGNACGELFAKTAACGPRGPAEACTTARECAARCFLASVKDPCAPLPSELTASASCTLACPR